MVPGNRERVSLYDEAKAGLSSLFKQTAQVFVGFVVMLLLTGGNPPAFVVALSVILGIGFVAWSEKNRIIQLKQSAASHQEIQELIERVKISPDESFIELANQTGLNLAEDLAGTDLSGVNLANQNLRGCNLSQANLSDADLRYADLSDANLTEVNLRNAKLCHANLNHANLNQALLIDADFTEAQLQAANLSQADLINTNLSDANLSGANLNEANLTEANFSNATVENAHFANNAGLSQDAKSDLEKRGAIFPEDERAPVCL